MTCDILCLNCGSSAFSFDTETTSVGDLHNKVKPCETCAFLGVVRVDEGHIHAADHLKECYVTFHLLDETDIAVSVEYSTLLDAYMKLQGKYLDLSDELNETLQVLEEEDAY